MPYKSIRDLPKQFSKHTAHGKRAAVSAFNSALKEYGDESTAFAVAHHAADQAEAAQSHKKRKA